MSILKKTLLTTASLMFFIAPVVALGVGFEAGMPYKFKGNARVYQYQQDGSMKWIKDESEYVKIYGSKNWGIIKLIGVIDEHQEATYTGKYFGTFPQCEAGYEKLMSKPPEQTQTQDNSVKCESAYNVSKEKLTNELYNVDLPNARGALKEITNKVYKKCVDEMTAAHENTLGSMGTWSTQFLSQAVGEIKKACDKTKQYNESVKEFEQIELDKIEKLLQQEHQACMNK